MNNFLTAETIHEQQNILGKTLIEVGSSHLCASFGIFCVKIGKFLETQWVFENMFENGKIADFERKWGQFRNLMKV